MHLILIRHGQTAWNVEGRWQGQTDLPLNERGQQQAYHMATSLRHFQFAALYSSDLTRALQTARIIGAELGLEVIPDTRLREINLGLWQGMLAHDIGLQFPEEFKLWHESPLSIRPPGGEDIQSLAARILQAVNEIIKRHGGQRVGVVSHELPIAAIVCRAAGLGLEHIRDMISQGGTWQEVLLERPLK